MTSPQVTSIEPGAIRDGEGSAEGSPARQAGQRDLSTVGLIVALIALAGLIAAPFFVYPVFLMSVLCFALFATAFNLLLGYVGLLSFGHAAFFGGAAYFTAHAAKVWGWEPLSAILLGAVGAGVIGLIVGFLAIRRQGIYFAMVTLALSQMIFFIFLQAPFTHGEDGIQGVPRGHLLGLIDLNDPLNIYYFVLAIFLVGFFAVWRIVHSPFGHILKAIRENENRAISLGYRVDRYKLGAFVMSAAIAGLAGSTKAIVFQIATLTDVAWQMSGEVVLMTLLGGMGTIFGPTIGAALVVTMQNYFATSDFPVTVLIGIIFVLCVLLFRRGIIGEAIRLLRR
ncbi:branched-chain amino acid ABC transporter permease [Aurantimonas sp. C2-6-R+9]|uniref:branched-chain amino acid ABC transporter permease n=1 Tax=unclassified Aurantimonas TaxID=2638230 RepID=UPI002E18939A|nr:MULTISPECIES: branched-chain amino acid ABC transporter permease [unclassified Aurantimonas]MEC5289170.1 branched-chain amino acid ABC transporter permease [Aurantimonas sp. C2-3-R2]MEC5382303.1 branched-chain amino acid ABC transporter permease [Aurantimonas sp. C2-6-R+9]MEC5410380.1 branched-chain amino acid ABC transporter permease [Aurantimonas sp. C2-4-R8]